ncbi:MAG: PhoH family protein [Rhodobacteraceae bacterium]|nr:PhoH family protein [Paracoccaceae bacterium]
MSETILEFDDNRRLVDLCGAHDRNLAVIEDRVGVTIVRRGNVLGLHGDQAPRDRASDILKALYARLEEGRGVEAGDVDAAIRMMKSDEQLHLFGAEKLEIRTRKRTIEPRTPGQKAYAHALLQRELVFGVGPAGTGKTYLAVAVGVAMLLEKRVDKIILSRPAVEAGERLGFLPGDMKEKIDPYLRPLYDALNDFYPGAKVEKLIEDGSVEVAPLAFMRGRTLSNAFIVLDEAQNTTEMQMRMFLTRMGENSRMVVTGDPSQVDLPRGVRSGLREALSILQGVEGVGVIELTDVDVVRHPLVARIVRAYARNDASAIEQAGRGS